MNYSIYKITNIINNKVYIGLTSRDPKIRFIEHYCRKSGTYLINAIQKYGKENFVLQIIEKNLSKKNAILKEIEYIKMYNSTNREIGYNLTFGGEGFSVEKHKEETKLKISKTKKSKDFDKYKIYSENLKQYYKNNPEKRSLIAKETYINKPELRIFQKNKLNEFRKNNPGVLGKPKKSIKLQKNGEIVEFNSLSEAAKALNCSISSLSNLNNGKIKSVKKYTLYKE